MKLKKTLVFTIFLLLFTLFYSQSGFCQCFQIESILVDACKPPPQSPPLAENEGKNEMVRFKVGPTSLNTSNLSVVWPNNPWGGLVLNPAVVNTLNNDILDAGGCGQLLEPVGGVLPANSSVILVTSYDIYTNTDSGDAALFGALNENIYILFQNSITGTGHFKNYEAGAGSRTLTMSFGGCSDTVTYIAGSLNPNDGATVNFTDAGMPSYINNNCMAPVPVFNVDAGPATRIVCAGATISLTGTAEGQQSVTWTAPVGSFSAPNSLITNYTVPSDATGTITLILKATTNTSSCEITDAVTLNIQNSTVPAFAPVVPICMGQPLSPLPLASTNGITGTWSPALNNMATTTYTFTPAAGQCATTTTLAITVNPASTVPTFNPVAAICAGTALSPLPLASTNGITGTWSPALNNMATTTYTFTPAAGQCATATTLAITVNPASTVPTFNPVAAICAGTALSPLPLASTNGITGTWSPALNNMATTTYTFTPAAGQCATTTTLAITVNPASTVPTFDLPLTVCANGTPITLPLVSLNGISGTWNTPEISSVAAGQYIFTPGPSQCAVGYTLNTSISSFSFTFNSGCVNDEFVIEAIPVSGIFDTDTDFRWTYNGSTVGSNEPALNVTKLLSGSPDTVFPKIYTLEATNGNGCTATENTTVNGAFCKIPKGISPGDNNNKNDTFDLTGMDVNEITIVNRYGTVVFNYKNYTNQWNGTSNSGKELPDGTYFYTISKSDGNTVSGWVYVIRKG